MTLSQTDAQATQAPPRLPLVPYVITCLVASIVVGFIAISSTNDAPPSYGDGVQNQRIAFNVAKYGVFSQDDYDTPDVQPTLRREPLYPVYLAVVLRIFTEIDDVSYACFLNEPECEPIRLLLVRANIPFYIALVWFFTAAAHWILRRWWLVWLGLTGLFIVDYFRYFVAYTELQGALFLLLHAMFLYRAVLELETGKRAYKFALISGLSLGALILIKAIFQYWIFLLIVGGILLVWRNHHNAVLLRSWGLLIASALLVIAPWVARNVVQLGEWRIAGRDNSVLAVRMQYLQVTEREYLASFAFFSSPVLSRHLLSLFDEADYHNLDRRNADSYYMQVRNQPGLMHEYRILADGNNTRAVISILRDNWAKHMAMSLVFAWRGSFVDGPVGAMEGHRLIYPKNTRFQYWTWRLRPYQMEIAGIIGIFFVPSMLGVAAYALKKRRWALLMFLMPALYSFGIHAAITHYIPRYSAPLVPIFIISLGLVISSMVSWVKTRRA